MTLMDVLGMIALALVLPPLLVGVVVLTFGDVIVAYSDSRKEGK